MGLSQEDSERLILGTVAGDPSLLANEVDRVLRENGDVIGDLTAQRDALLAVVKLVEWVGRGIGYESGIDDADQCPCCDNVAHTKDCELAKALELCGENVK